MLYIKPARSFCFYNIRRLGVLLLPPLPDIMLSQRFSRFTPVEFALAQFPAVYILHARSLNCGDQEWKVCGQIVE